MKHYLLWLTNHKPFSNVFNLFSTNPQNLSMPRGLATCSPFWSYRGGYVASPDALRWMEGRCCFVRFIRATDVSDSCNSLQTAGEKKQYQYGNLMQFDLYSVYSLAVNTYQPGHVASTGPHHSWLPASCYPVAVTSCAPGRLRSACPVWRSSCAGRAQVLDG